MGEWKKVKLGDICTLNYGKSLTKNKRVYGDIPVYSSAGITGWHNKPLVNSKGIIIGRKGSVGTVYKSIQPFYCIDTAYYIVPNENKYNFDYLYYCLKNIGLNYLNEDSAVPGLNRENAYSQNILLPSPNEQKAIAYTLSCLDDKIEINNKINEKLEEMAQAIFKSWFVDFEPFKDGEFIDSELGSIPIGWRVVELKDIAEDIVCGKTPSTKHSEYYGGYIPFITIPDMHGKIYVTNTERYLSEKGVNTQRNKIIPRNSVCVSCIATAGLVCLVSSESQTNQQINTIVCKPNVSPFFIYLTMSTLSRHIIMLGSSGSTTCNLNKGQFSKIKIVLPSEKVMKKFSTVVEQIFYKIEVNQIENEKLSHLRDTLLPKLMSGEIDVSKAQI